MIEVIPTIIAHNREELEAGIKRYEPFVDRIHLDIMDGEFVEDTTIAGYEELAALDTKLKIEVHLMVQNPESVLDAWLSTKADKVCIHRESSGNLAELLQKISATGRSAGMALNPETSTEALVEFLPLIEYIQFMTVHPGKYGATFLPETVEKISRLHAESPLPISVDGGINIDTAPAAIAAGATTLCCGSYLLKAQDINSAINALKQL